MDTQCPAPVDELDTMAGAKDDGLFFRTTYSQVRRIFHTKSTKKKTPNKTSATKGGNIISLCYMGTLWTPVNTQITAL